MFLVILITKLGQEFVFNYIDNKSFFNNIDYKARTRVCFLVILITKLGQDFFITHRLQR